jgi:hypothetical protein
MLSKDVVLSGYDFEGSTKSLIMICELWGLWKCIEDIVELVIKLSEQMQHFGGIPVESVGFLKNL